MSSFVHLEYPTRHPGVARFETALQAARQVRKSFDSAKGLTAMLLAAMVAALVVVADQLVDTWADGHLLAAWVTLWAIGFAALGLLAAPARRLAKQAATSLDAWSRNVARRRADQRLWEIACRDPRVMADLRAAQSRAESLESPVTQAQTRAPTHAAWMDKPMTVRPTCYISYL